MCFCSILPSSSSKEDLLALHLFTQNMMLMNRLSRISTLLKSGETLRYQMLEYYAYREMFYTSSRFLRSVEIMVSRDT